ncbi:hypothetical protein [Longimicrobium sp.]|uniref:hypothetical protein n=1 Tax=Longimicrobium sp. TaxID=2029185 RepID=UPI003B3BC8B9
MTIAICLKVGDGVVLGTDSASSLIGENDRYFNVYNTAEKTFNLVKGLPIGLMTYGLGGMAGLSIGALARDLRERLSGNDPELSDWALNPSTYTLHEVAGRVREFFYEALYDAEFGPLPQPGAGAQGTEEEQPLSPDVGGTPGEKAPPYPDLGFVVAGISAQDHYTQVWTIEIINGVCTGPVCQYDRFVSGVVNFWGQPEALYRLVYGWSPEAHQRLIAAGLNPEAADQFLLSLTDLAHPGMPIQDAIDLVRYLADVTVGYIRFKQGAPTVAPPIDIAAIMRHQGFKWVERKHYYRQELNPAMIE